VAYQAEQLVRELQDSLPVHEKARAEQLIDQARTAIQQEAGLDQVRPLIADLQQVVHGLPAAASAGTGAGGGPGPSAGGDGNGASGDGAADDEEVVDAEFTRE
jgi:molecular chaperone DnaK